MIPFRCAVTFRVLRGGALRGLGGEEGHGLVFQVLARENAETASEWHARKRKPFQQFLNAKEWTKRKRDGWVHFAEGERVVWHVHLWDDAGEQFLRGVLRERVWRLGPMQVEVEAVRVLEIWQRPEEPPPEELRMRVIRPAGFRQRGRTLPLPEPTALFRGLAARWAEVTGETWPERRLRELMEKVLLRGFKIRDELVEFRRARMVGFVGEVRWMTKDEASREMAWRLLQLARLVGIGAKTAMGMGVVRLPGYSSSERSVTSKADA